jgi:hypothetical protein
MKLILRTVKPRNPFVAASLQRKAGGHRMGRAAQRQRAESALRRELDHLSKPSP